jgi:hypothetical protein
LRSRNFWFSAFQYSMEAVLRRGTVCAFRRSGAAMYAVEYIYLCVLLCRWGRDRDHNDFGCDRSIFKSDLGFGPSDVVQILREAPDIYFKFDQTKNADSPNLVITHAKLSFRRSMGWPRGKKRPSRTSGRRSLSKRICPWYIRADV